MTETEGRALARTTAVLALAAVVRWGMTSRAGPPLLPPDSAAALPGLLDESRLAREEAARRNAPLAEGERVDPNTASDVELDRLPGVGPAAAREIVAAREALGGFRRPEDLLAVRGIGPATLERMRPHLDFSRAPPGGAPAGGALAGARAAGGAGAGPVDVNRADARELQRLPGIGPALAERIVEERTRRGRFRTPEDLLVVRGIGPATLERLRPLVVVR